LWLWLLAPGGSDLPETTAECYCFSIGIAAEIFADEMLSVVCNTFHFIKLFFPQ
jgi:hypothetical protein